MPSIIDLSQHTTPFGTLKFSKTKREISGKILKKFSDKDEEFERLRE